jgi:hypothetical protein
MRAPSSARLRPMIRSDEDIFQDALAQPEASRAFFLEEACGGDEACRARVSALLAAHDRATRFVR